MKKRILWLLLIAVVFVSVMCGTNEANAANDWSDDFGVSVTDSDDNRVYDYADILSGSQEAELYARIIKLQDKHKMDIIILTSDDIDGKSWEAYADDFYDEHAFGYEQEHGTGIIFLISMDSSNRGITITTSGHAMENFTDLEIEWMYDDIIEYMYDADYNGGCECFLELVDDYVDNSEVAENGYYDEEANDWVETSASPGSVWKRTFSFGSVLIRLLISSVIGLVVVLILRSKAKTKATVSNSTYLESGRLDYKVKSDVFTGTTETKRRIPDSSSSSGGGHSSVHTSSGGFSHGGGGGRGF